MSAGEIRPEEIQRIGRWPVRRYIGAGGFSWVFEVEDEGLGQRRALKILKPEAAAGEGYKRFWREARILAAIDDPHLVRIYELDHDPERKLPYYVMEFLTGSDLGKLLKRNAAEGRVMEPARAVEIFLGVLQGLARLHELRPIIVHRDIKPGNIQITDAGKAKLLDLGIAHVTRSSQDETVEATNLTRNVGFIGTVFYASREQLRVEELGPPSDIFALGICLFETLEGHHPYNDIEELPTKEYQTVLRFYERLEITRGELSVRFRRTPKALQPVIRKALAVRPEDRFRNAMEMHDALEQAFYGAKPDSQTGPRPQREHVYERPRRDRPARWPIVATAAALLLTAAGLGWWLLFPTPEPTPEDVTPAQGATQKPFVETEKPLVETEPEPPPSPKPVVSEPTPLQMAARDEASQLVARLQVDGSLAAADIQPVLEKWRDGEQLWEQEKYGEAEKAYRGVTNTGTQVISLSKERRDASELAALREGAKKARDAAQQAGAEFSAPSEWSGAEDLLKQEQYASATGAYDSAAGIASKALSEARKAESGAKTSRGKLPKGGACNAVDAPGYQSACQEGASAFKSGSAALAAKNAPEALGSFQEARARFDEAFRLVPEPPPNKLPTLTLTPADNFDLEVGESRTIRADAEDPEGKPVQISYAIEWPGRGRVKASGESYRFEPDREGNYKIVGRATDSDGGVSSPVQIFARVSPKVVIETPVDKPVHKPAPGKTAYELKPTLDEYADAIQSKDIDVLKRVWKMDRTAEDLYSKIFTKDYALSVSVTPLSENVRGNQASLRFSQSLQAVDKQGKRLPLAEGVFDAQLLRRSEGWQFQSIKKSP